MKHLLRHLFVPHHSNNHRSKLLHYDSLLMVIALLFAGLLVIQGMHKEYPAVLGDSISITVDDLLYYTNLKRTANGLAPLTLNQQLSAAAQQKAKDMFAKNYWAHVAPDGTTPWVFIRGAGYDYLYAGENLARGFDSSAAVVNAWMDSPTHRENLLSPHYTDIGFAIESGSLTGTDTVLIVQEFGSPYSPKDETADATGQSPPQVAPTTVASANTTIPSPTAGAMGNVANEHTNALAGVSSAQNNSILDVTTVKRNISFFFLVLFIFVLALDAIYIERKQIACVFFHHNIDHMLYLLFILIAGIVIGRGVIL